MKKFILPLLAVLICGILLAAMLAFPETKVPASSTPPQTTITDSPPQSTGSDSTSPIPEEVLLFPLELENNRLLMNPPFSYDGLNPDSNYAEGRNIAAITVQNQSAQHLIQADLTLVAADGTEILFCVEHLPSDKRITAFALDNAPLPADAAWVEVLVSAQFAEQPSLRGNGVDITENGMLLEVTNSTDTELSNLKIYCHNLLGEEYFGGKSYPYEINNLPAGETVTVEALDCILGIAEAAYTEGN